MPLNPINNLFTRLTGAINIGDVALEVSPLLVAVQSTAGFPMRDVFSVDSEVFFYDQNLAGADSTHFAVTHRAYDGTESANHLTNAFAQQRMVAQHQNESLNQWRKELTPSNGDGSIILSIAGVLTLSQIELDVTEVFEQMAGVRITVTAEEITPSSPLIIPPEVIILDYDETELDSIARWTKAINEKSGTFEHTYTIRVYWDSLSPGSSLGRADLIINTAPKEE